MPVRRVGYGHKPETQLEVEHVCCHGTSYSVGRSTVRSWETGDAVVAWFEAKIPQKLAGMRIL
jgi:hypothetical protein